jgi:hypothetical protein
VLEALVINAVPRSSEARGALNGGNGGNQDVSLVADRAQRDRNPAESPDAFSLRIAGVALRFLEVRPREESAMPKVCPACAYEFTTDDIRASIGIAYDGDVSVRLSLIQGPFIVQCVRSRDGRPVLATVLGKQGNVIGEDVEVVEGTPVPVFTALKVNNHVAVFRSGPLFHVRCDVFVPDLNIKMPLADAAEYLSGVRRYDLIFEDGRVDGRLFGEPCRPSRQALRIAEGLAGPKV